MSQIQNLIPQASTADISANLNSQIVDLNNQLALNLQSLQQQYANFNSAAFDVTPWNNINSL